MPKKSIKEFSSKSPNPVDIHVGTRVRMRRIMLGLSQEKLGGALGLSFQQVQKYEKGRNRIGSSRLQQISHILKVPVAFFFESAPVPHEQSNGDTPAPSPAYIDEFLATSEGQRLIRAYTRLKKPGLKTSFIAMVEQIAEGEPQHA